MFATSYKWLMVWLLCCCTVCQAYADDGNDNDSIASPSCIMLPTRFNIMLGAGLTLPDVRGNRYDFFAKNGNHLGYQFSGGGRYYLRHLPELGFGIQYDYVNANRHHDKAHMHFIRPEIVLRAMNDRQTAALFVSVGAGYFRYGERVYYPKEQPMVGETPVGTYPGHRFEKGYFGGSFSIGGEAAITRHIGFFLRFDALTADWYVNRDARLFDLEEDPYDDAEHHFFRNNIRFFSLSLGLEFGN